ncbi:hypothetical protein ACIBCR_16480 [Micromonospora echinospora]|uniref:hypothetical protein n=1 Tax=Micromonospora echinospora TaxID=1877 RepID=UPI0037B50498
MTNDLCPTTSPHPAHRRDLGPFGVRDCPGVAAAHDAPYDAGDAPSLSRPLPVHDDAEQLRQQIRALETANNELSDRISVYAINAEKQAQALASQAEQLRRNGTLLCRVQDAVADIDRAWADHDTIGDAVVPDNPTVLRAAAHRLRKLAEEHAFDSLGFGIDRAADTLDAWAGTPDDLTEDDVDALTQALEKADSARIDRDGDLWRPTTDGRWTCPGLDRLTLDELEDGWGPTRPVLLVDIEPDDHGPGDPTAALGSPAPRAHVWAEPTDLVRWPHCSVCGVVRRHDDQHGPCKGPTRVTLRTQDQPDDLATRLAGRLADALGRLEEAGRSGIWVGRFPTTELDRWRELLAEHADRSTAAGWTAEADRLDQAAAQPAHDHTGGGLPLFAPDAVLHVNSIDGDETWTGAEWNDHARAATRNGRAVPERMVQCPRSVCTTTCPVDQATREG